MICLQIINLLAEDQCPQVLAKELDDIQRVSEAWAVPGKSARSAQASIQSYASV